MNILKAIHSIKTGAHGEIFMQIVETWSTVSETSLLELLDTVSALVIGQFLCSNVDLDES